MEGNFRKLFEEMHDAVEHPEKYPEPSPESLAQASDIEMDSIREWEREKEAREDKFPKFPDSSEKAA